MIHSVRTYDVLIAGGGPAGCACALALKDSGLRVALLEKDKVPRDKTCGESIGGRVKTMLRQLDPDYETAFAGLPDANPIFGIRYFAPDGSNFETVYQNPGCTINRSQFDHFLWDLCSKNTDTEFIDQSEIVQIHPDSDGYRIETKQGKLYHAGFLVGSDGANSCVKKLRTPSQDDRQHYSIAVRAHFVGVDQVNSNTMEVHMLASYLPGYFWLFPLPNNQVNVGFGMLARNVYKRKINICQALKDVISLDPLIKRFQNAEQIDPISGWGLPLASRRVAISGDRFLLTGDAAHLVDCITGEGIANAMESGILAAEQIQQCHDVGRFDAPFLKQYDQRINRTLRSGQRIKALARDVLGNQKRFLNFIVDQASRNPRLNTWIRKTF